MVDFGGTTTVIPQTPYDVNALAATVAAQGVTLAALVSSLATLQPFPVGGIYINITGTNPATELGYGTWTAFGTGRTLVGLNSGDVDFDTPEETGGSKTVSSAGSVAAPVFTGSALAGHTHTTDVQVADHATTNTLLAGAGADIVTGKTHSVSGNPVASSSNSAGTPAGTNSAPAFTGSATSVVQPYIVVYFWKRTV